MKCSNCPFVVDTGVHEYPEMTCEFFGYSVPKEFDSEDHEGCNLRFIEALMLEILQTDQWDYKTKDYFREKLEKDCNLTELQGKHKKREELYRAYFEDLKKRRKKKGQK